jgi:hypothetical protein
VETGRKVSCILQNAARIPSSVDKADEAQLFDSCVTAVFCQVILAAFRFLLFPPAFPANVQAPDKSGKNLRVAN